ncbi:hypothetical protein ACP70R_047563 [Stipagrostis hirtigluma subsp. patula]
MAAAAAAAAPAVARIQRGRLVSLSLVVPCAFLLGVLWLASALNIARSVQRCLAVEGSVWDYEEYRLLIKWPSTFGIVSLVFMLFLRQPDASAGDQAAGGAKDGGPGRKPALALPPQRRHMGPPDPAIGVFLALCMGCAMLMLSGLMRFLREKDRGSLSA